MNHKIRLQQPEQLDNLSLSGLSLQNTLSSLKFINTFFGTHRQLSKSIVSYCKSKPTVKTFNIVDIGCGGGDCIAYISKELKKQNIAAVLTGIDGNPESISYAIQQNSNNSFINYMVADILDVNFVPPPCDILISSHFIYHFNTKNLHLFLNKIQPKKIKHVIFSELNRNILAYYAFKTIQIILPISRIAKKDGLIAIQRAFTYKELKTILQNNGIRKYKILKKPFFRMIAQITFTQ
ncbi:methyltransferase domain-containing protein [Aquimarina sp. I32.4]|uniref:methyltransferase domain-containing protein n=1 Tax=Aquimarina sp. I32.4 TaxID=2053903 RepID=UPI001304CA20|nr:methyltransferase domain-containing protein [Aquimarina sp. I32.4]